MELLTKCESEYHSDFWKKVYEDVYRESLYGNQPLQQRKKAYDDAMAWLRAREKHLETCKEEDTE